MNAPVKPDTVITGTRSLAAIIDRAKRHNKLTDREMLRRAGLSPNALTNLRERNTDTFITTAAALLNALGYDLVAVPAGEIE